MVKEYTLLRRTYVHELIDRQLQHWPAYLKSARIIISPKPYYTPKYQDIMLGINRKRNFNDGKEETQLKILHVCFSTEAWPRIYTVYPSNDEYFYLRLLLVNVHVPASF